MVLVVAAREISPAKNQQAGPAFLPSCRGRASCQTCVSLQWMLKRFPSPLWALVLLVDITGSLIG